MSKYDLLSSTPPQMPKNLPGFVKFTISKVPSLMKPAAANALFPPSAALMHDVQFEYVDDVLHEPAMMEGCVAISGIGKSYLDAMIEAIIRSLRTHDEISDRKLLEWSRQYKSTSSNKAKPERPTDAATLVPEPDMTNPAFIQLLMDAQHEGNRSIYTRVTEIDLLDQCCGCHKKVTKVIRTNFDTQRYGAHRATAEGITGRPFLRWKFNFSCVPEKAQKFFNDGLEDGTLGRIGISHVPKPSKKGGIPKQGKYDEAYYEKLDEYLIRLSSATGTIKVPRINKLVKRLNSELDELAELTDNAVFESLCHRSVVIAWLKGCIIYIAEGYRWSNEIADFVEWSLYYDLWSKVAIFAPQMKPGYQIDEDNIKKFGPANMLDMMPLSFCTKQLEELRISLKKPANATNQLSTWQARNYITFDATTGLYTKTDSYLAKHGQK